MFSSKIFVSALRKPVHKCTFLVSSSRGIKQFRMDDEHYKPGNYRERNFQRTWAEIQVTEEQPRAVQRGRQPQRNPRRREQIQEEMESRTNEARSRNTMAINAHYPSRAYSTTTTAVDPPKRLQKTTIPAKEFMSQLILDQKKNKMRHYEAEVVACRIGQTLSTWPDKVQK